MGTLIGDTQGLAHHGEHTAHGTTDKKKNKVHTNKKSKNAILVMCYGIL